MVTKAILQQENDKLQRRVARLEKQLATHKQEKGDDRFRSLFEQAPVAYQSLDEQGTFIDVNPAFSGLTGYSAKELLGKKFGDLWSQATCSAFHQAFEQLKQKGSIQADLRLIRKDGIPLEVALDGSVQRDAQGKFIRTHCILHDVTERIRAEEQLRESEAHYRLIADNTSDVIWVMDPTSGKFTYVSPSVEKLRGYTPEEVMAQPVNEALTPESIKTVSESMARNLPAFIAQGSGVKSFVNEVDQPCKDGSIVHTEVTTTYLFNKQGQVEIVGVTRDIMARKRLEENLRENEQRATLLFQKSAVPVFVIQLPEVMIADANEAAEKLTGYTRAEMIGRNAAELGLISHKKRAETINEFEKEKGLSENEMRIHTKTGEERVIVFNTNPLLIGGKPFAITSMQDITERKLAEKKLHESERRLKSLVTASSEALYQMSADWKVMLQLSSQSFLANTPEPDPNWMDKYIHPDDQSRVTFAIQEAIRTRSVFEMEHRVLSADGTLGWTSSRAIPVLDENGEILEWFGAASDITARKQADEKLRESERRLREAQQIASVGNWEWDMLTNDVWWSEETYRIFGVKPEEYIPSFEANSRFIHPEDSDAYGQAFDRSLKFGVPLELDIRIMAGDGKLKQCYSKGYVARDDSGQPTRFVGTVMDITARKQAEEKLRESEEFLRLAYEATDLGIWKNDLRTGSVEFDERARIHYGFDTLYTNIVEVTNRVHPEDVTRLGSEIAAATAPTGNGKFATEYRVIHPDGSVHWLAIGVQVAFEGEGEQRHSVVGYGTTLDITERKQAEEARARLAERLDLAARGAQIGIWDWDIQKNEIVWDEQMYALYGLPPGEFGGAYEAWLNGVHPDDREPSNEVSAAAVRGEREYDTEFRVLWRDGSVHWLKANGQVFRDEHGNPTRMVGVNYDITERKQAEIKRDQFADRLDLATRSARMGIWDWDLQKNDIVWDNQMYVLYGVKPGEFNSAHEIWQNRVHFDDQATRNEAIAAAVRGERNYDIEFRILWSDNSVHWLKGNGQVFRDEQGAPLRMVGMNYDITESKQAEEKIQESEIKFRALFENSPLQGVIWKLVRDLHGEIVDWEITDINPLGAASIGLQPEEAIGKRAVDLFGSEAMVAYLETSRQIAASGKPLLFETHFDANGRDYLSSDFLVGSEHYANISMDITERKQAENKLRESEYRLRQSQHIAHIGSWEWNLRTGETHWSPENYALHGLNPNAPTLTPDMLLKYVHPDDVERVTAVISQAVSDGNSVELDYRIFRTDGALRVIHAVGEVTEFDAEGKPLLMLGTNQDITDRKRMEDELRRSNAELEQFAYIASHDLQEPLRTIAGMVQLLQKRYEGQLDERADEYIGHAVESASRMQALIRDLLAYSRVDRKNQPIAETRAQDCLQIALKNLGAAIEECHAEITADALPTVHADPMQLTQLLQNLIGNSLKFRGKETPRVQISATQVNGSWRFAVQDNGIGIEPQYFERIFLVFQRLHTRRQYQGTGIGLALCKKIIERHGGSIWVESQPGTGSTFYFTLPIRSSL